MYNRLIDEYSKKYAKELRAIKEEGIQEGIQQGIQQGFQKSIKEGMRRGSLNASVSIAKAMLLDGVPIEVVEKYTKLDMETLVSL